MGTFIKMRITLSYQIPDRIGHEMLTHKLHVAILICRPCQQEENEKVTTIDI